MARTTGAVARAKVAERYAAPDVMSRATFKANASSTEGLAKSVAYYYGGSVGDSIERRFQGGPGDFLGGGGDFGGYGTQSTYPAVGFGNFFGTGLGFGAPGRMSTGFGGAGMSGMGGFQYLKRYSGSASFNHSLIAACMMAYLGYGVVRNVVDLYTDFALEGLDIHHPDVSVSNFYKAWWKKVRGKAAAKRAFADLFISGNVFMHRRWARLNANEKRTLKRAGGEATVINDALVVEGRQGYREIKPSAEYSGMMLTKKASPTEQQKANAASPLKEGLPPNTKKLIPWGYTSLNPLQMELRGKRFRNEHHWAMVLDRMELREIQDAFGTSHTQELGTTEIDLPQEFKGKIRKYQGSGAGYAAEITLSENDIYPMQDRKFNWWDWAVPFIFPALRAIQFKDCLRNMEIKACQSIINSIFLFKLGDIDKGLVAEDEHFERLADMLQIPGQALNILWNEAITAEVIQPDVRNIFDPKKHESADRDIFVSLGIPEALLGGKGGSFANAFVALAGILEKIESTRDIVHEWLMNEAKIVADAMGFKKLPKIKFGRTSLRDKNAERTFLTNLFDRGILSAETILNEIGTTVEIEAQRQESEKEVADKTGVNVMDKRGPYWRPEQMIKDAAMIPPGWDKEHKITEQMEEKEEKEENRFQQQMTMKNEQAKQPPGGKNAKTPTGRPGGKKDSTSRGPQQKKRPPQGQNVAALAEMYSDLHEYGGELLDNLEKAVGTKLLRARGLRYIKQFPQQERERLENMVFNVFSHMPPAPRVDAVSDDFLLHVLDNQQLTNRMKAGVLENYHKQLAQYEEKFSKPAGKEYRRRCMVSAWTQLALTAMCES